MVSGRWRRSGSQSSKSLSQDLLLEEELVIVGMALLEEGVKGGP